MNRKEIIKGIEKVEEELEKLKNKIENKKFTLAEAKNILDDLKISHDGARANSKDREYIRQRNKDTLLRQQKYGVAIRFKDKNRKEGDGYSTIRTTCRKQFTQALKRIEFI